MEKGTYLSNKQRILVALAGIGAFAIVVIVFFTMFENASVERTASSIMSVISGLIVVWIILSLSGILKEFSIKSPFFEMTANLKEKINEVKNDTEKLQQSIQGINQRIDNVITTVSTSSAKAENVTNNYYNEAKGKIESTFKHMGVPTQAIGSEPQITHDDIKELTPLVSELEAYRKALGKPFSDDIDIALLQTKYYFGTDNYEKVIQICDNVLERYPNDATALNNKGLALIELHRYNEAEPVIDRALNIDPRSPPINNNKGLLLSYMGRNEEALRYYENALHAEPNNINGLNNKISSLYHLGRFDEALNLIEIALNIGPNFPNVLFRKGLILYKQRKLQEAIELFDKAFRSDDSYLVPLSYKGITLIHMGKMDEGSALIDNAIQLEPKQGYGYYNKARAESITKNKEKAIVFLEQAINIDSYFCFLAKKEEDFDFIKNDPKFITLVNRMS